jgi:hypothetical protein
MSIGEHSPTVVPLSEELLDRMVLAVEKVRDRLQRSTAALEAAKVPYAVIGGNAVAAWVSTVDRGRLAIRLMWTSWSIGPTCRP